MRRWKMMTALETSASSSAHSQRWSSAWCTATRELCPALLELLCTCVGARRTNVNRPPYRQPPA
jgi:hypothetical protein